MTTDRLTAAVGAATAALVALAACSPPVIRRFPSRAPMQRDDDMTSFAPKPAKYEAPEIWDTIDNTVFGPLVDTFALARNGRARNVTALDEVADSSWFENRIERVAPDLEAIGRGACIGDDPDPAGPWTVIQGKPNGANPGFMVEHASGVRFFFKPDTVASGERQSTADMIATRAYHAAGYHTACIRIAYIAPAHFVLSPKATTKDFVGDKVPFTQAMLDKALASGIRDATGAVRGELSQLLDGEPIGPWRDFGTRPDDPNDVVPHEDRRELRGSYVLGAWLAHYDAREQNSLDTWIATDGDAGYVRHYMFDFGDCLGSQSAWGRVTRRRGYAYELDWPLAFGELFTLGMLDRPWRNPKLGPGGKTLGYFTADPFWPDRFRTAYPFGPYKKVTEADAAWGARILARITPAAIHLLVGQARLSDPAVAAALEAALLGRRSKLLARFLTVLSPLTRPRIDDAGRLCVSDARHDAGLIEEPAALTIRTLAGSVDAGALAITPGTGAGEQCIAGLPAGAAMPAYVVLAVRVDRTRPLRVHLYSDHGAYRIAGIERDD